MMPILHAAIAMVREIPKPVIAALNGVAAGGGFGLALACDFRIASPKVSLLTAFLGIGASPDSSSTFFLPRHVGLAKATEMFLRNKPVSAEEALDLGLVTAVVEPDNVMDEAKKLAEELAQGPTAAFGRTKLLLNQSLGSSLHEQLHSEARSITLSMGTPDFAEGIKAFMEKRKPTFKGQ
jgi:2-(1,2-epoxy-1,2-dihydrophenyl)acetyl-CoA isomerase